MRHALATPGVNGVIPNPDAEPVDALRALVDEHAPGTWERGQVVLTASSARITWDTMAVWAHPARGYGWSSGATTGEGVPPVSFWAAVAVACSLGTGRSAMAPAERFGAAAFLPTDAAPAGRLKARTRAGFREYARAGGWARSPDGADLRSDWGELGRGEYLLTQAEAELADVESPEVMQADARAIAACRDYDAAALHAEESEQSAQGALLRRCRVRLDRALAAAEWEARRRG